MKGFESSISNKTSKSICILKILAPDAASRVVQLDEVAGKKLLTSR